MLHKVPMVWFLSVYKIFEMDGVDDWFIVGIPMVLIDAGLKIHLFLL